VALRTFVVDIVPEDGTVVPKRVGVGTLYEVFFMVYFIVFYLVHFVGLKYGL
jgi:hypothetical protein